MLHSLLAYNRTTDGEELVPLVSAILRAAEDVDFKAEFPLGRVKYDDIYHMKQFYSDIEVIKSDIAAIESATEKVIVTSQQHDEAALAIEATKIFNRAENCEKKLELLQEESSHIQKELNESKEEKKNTDDLIVREELVNNLHCKFSAAMKRYQESLKEVTDEDFYAAMSTDRKSGGSSRLLLDQLNRAKWSPLHLVCLQGGFMSGKVPLLRVLLQEHPDSSQQLLTLLDRQNRNVLHHLLEISEPTDDTFRALHYVIGREFSLLLQKDDRGKTPLDYVFDHYYTYASSFRRNNGLTGEERYEKSYLMLKVLVGYLERGEPALGTYATNDDDEEVSNDNIIPQNLFHAVCRLPMGVCPELMFKFLYKDTAPIVKEVDENGNTALHLLLVNPSYAGDGNAPQQPSYRPRNRAYNQSQREFRYVLASNRDAIYIQNNSGHLPLRIAMDAGRRDVISDLIMLNHEAVLLDERFEDTPILIAHVLGIVASSKDVLEPDSEPKIVDDVVHPLDTMFKLLRARPDFVSFGRSDEKEAVEERSNNGGKMSWRKKLNPFRLFSRESKR